MSPDPETSELNPESTVAIIGMAGRFPGAGDVAAFWQNLCDGVEAIATLSEEELIAAGIDAALRNDPHYVRAAGVLAEIDQFDASFFGYSPREAELMDPQQRLFLECAWHVLENAGYNPDTYPGAIGVYAGSGMNTYLCNNVYPARNPLKSGRGYEVMIASDKDFLATKACYKLNLKGPGVTVQTACSTSLVAVHLACQSLRNGECDLALAGGVSLRVPHKAGYLYQEGMILSPDGHCRAFDAQAQGTVIGSGAGLVALKLLANALADGDRIYAVIRGSAINNDGALKAGYTAPGLDAQAAVIAEAQGVAGVSAASITYVETHGTGTPIGDPIEIAALTKAFRLHTERKGFCAIGSVKTNLGHLDAAAGIAGLIKTALALEHKAIPPSLNFNQPNPRIDFANSPFHVNTRLAEWATGGKPRRAGVSSFGIGGTNAHLVLEEAPQLDPSGPARPWQVLVWSAKTESALQALTAGLADYFQHNPGIELADAAYTLQAGRKPLNCRRVLVCRSGEEAQQALAGQGAGILSENVENADRSVAFMFTGQGAQYVGMGGELYQSEATFRRWVDECAEILRPHLNLDLRDVLYPAPERAEAAAQQLKQTALTQPALFTIEYALAQVWLEWGIQPQAMIGHSIGEYVAACLAGVFSLEDALALVAARGRLMQSLPAGAMLAISLPVEQVQKLLDAEISLAAVNAPAACVVSGPTPAIERLEQRLAQQGINTQRLHTSHAFHSAMMEPILEPFMRQFSQISLHPPQIPYLSNVTGNWITPGQATDPAYWAKHLRQAVRFAEGVGELLKEPKRVLLEVGPGRTLSTLATRHSARTAGQAVVPSLRHPQDQQSDIAFLLTSLGKLWLAGAQVDWEGFHAHEQRQRLPLPTYPFERQRYWIDAIPPETAPTRADQPLDRKPDPADWFYLPTWKRMPVSAYRPEKPSGDRAWLLFVDEHGLGETLARQLEQAGQTVISVKAGAAFTRLDDHHYTLNPQHAEDYDALLKNLGESAMPSQWVHLWQIAAGEAGGADLENLDRTQAWGFYSLMFLAQALGRQNYTGELQLHLVTNRLHNVLGESVQQPVRATALGLAKILPYEYPNLHCRCIDVDFSPAEAQDPAQLARCLLSETTTASQDEVVAYRRAQRWVQAFDPIRLDQQGTLPADLNLRENGVYLISGGLGGMGLTLAKYLAETVHARLVLIGRSASPSHHKVQQLEACGAAVLVLQADVSDPAQVQAAVQQAIARFGAIHGVIHAAGVPGGGMLQLKTRADTEKVLAPKLRGTLVLAEALQAQELDFFILCSSINTQVHRLGQTDYCAANTFLETFAHSGALRNARQVHCIDWDTWREVGMAAAAYQALAQPVAQNNPHPLFDQCLLLDDTQAMFATHFSVGGHWVLHEHGVLGNPTVPGTTYLEMARAAFTACTGQAAVEIQDAYFLAPLILDDDETREVRTVLKKNTQGFAFSILSQAGAEHWQTHAKGLLVALDEAPTRAGEIREIEKRCEAQAIDDPLAQTHLGHFDLQRRKIERGVSTQGEPRVVDALVITDRTDPAQPRTMEFGPRWQGLQWVRLGPQEGIACFALPEDYQAEQADYPLHPALLDFATSFLRLFKSEGSYLPLSYKRLRYYRALSGPIHSYAQFVNQAAGANVTLSFDLTLTDDDGQVLVEIDEFSVMRIEDTGKLAATGRSLDVPADIASLLPKADHAADDFNIRLSAKEGVDVLQRVLRSNLPQVVVSTSDLAARVRQAKDARTALFDGAQHAGAAKARHQRPNMLTNFAPPRNESEQKLAKIWEDVLHLEPVGIHDNFFELGGDSLLITQVHTQFKAQFEREVSVATLLQYPTIADLAQFLNEQAKATQPSFEKVQQRAGQQKEALKRRNEKRRQLHGRN